MVLGSCVTNCNGNVGYIVSQRFQDEKSEEWFFKVIWVDTLIDATIDGDLYPQILTITEEREIDLIN